MTSTGDQQPPIYIVPGVNQSGSSVQCPESSHPFAAADTTTHMPMYQILGRRYPDERRWRKIAPMPLPRSLVVR